jgi:uncharacterized protein with PQ loop repeat
MASDQGTSGFGFTEALLLGLLTAAVYVAAYSYESSICAHFAIPQNLIKVSTEVLVGSFLAVTGFLLSGIILVNIAITLLVPSKRDPNSLWHCILIVHVCIICFGVFLFQAIGFTWHRVAYFVGVIAAIDAVTAAVIAVVVIFIRRQQRRYPMVDFNEVARDVAADPPLDVFLLLSRHVQRQYLVAAACLLIVWILAAFAGMRMARLERRFFAIESKGLVIVRSYGDSFICKPVVGEQGESLGRDTVILTTQQLTDVPLKVKDFAQPPRMIGD